jgi:hypothetical protein
LVLLVRSLWHLQVADSWAGGLEEESKKLELAPTYKYYTAELRVVVERYLLIQSKGDKVALEEFVKERQELTKQMLEVLNNDILHSQQH